MPYPFINETFVVGSTFSCEHVSDMEKSCAFDTITRQTISGCQILLILQYMYQFKITYTGPKREHCNLTSAYEPGDILYPKYGDHIDIYTRPMTISQDLLDNAYPIQAVYNTRFGFILRQSEYASFYRVFYSKPFSRPLWNCLYGMALLVAAIFCLMKRCEKRFINGCRESSVSYEILMVIGSYCQHIPPIYATLFASRTAYFVFFVFSYVIYSFYTSNLLSHLVNDRNKVYDLNYLAQSDIDCVIVNSTYFAIKESLEHHRNLSIVEKKLLHMKPVSILDGLEAVNNGGTALLSDYVVLYPFLRPTLNNEAICKTIQIDLFSDIKKYFFTSKNFSYKTEFKTGILRAKEAGLFKRRDMTNFFTSTDCNDTQFQTNLLQISTPLAVLVVTNFVCVIILLIERAHYKRNKVFPYVE